VRFFTCVLDTQGLGLGNRTRQAYEVLPRQRGLNYEWQCFESAAVLTGWDDPYGDPLVAQGGDWIAAGIVRLDNRPEIEKWVHRREKAATDLELVLSVVAQYGGEYVSKLLGDFAFVAWNGKRQSGVAACDAFAVQKIFYTQRGRSLSFASRAEALASGDEYELSYLLALVSLHDRPRGATVYKGVRQLPPASLAAIGERRIAIRQYWHAADFAMEPSWVRSEVCLVEECRQLLADSVRQRMTSDSTTWAQLSGGLDSSSVVSFVQWLAERHKIPNGLAGTVTFVDRQRTSTDERAYSDAVVSRWRVRNELIVDPPTWYDESSAPPRTDQPRGDLHVYPRDNRLCAIVRAAGGRVLLTGVGGDELFSGNMLYFADWLARGRLLPALREMARRAAIGRVSFWALAYRNALLPLLPRAMQTLLVHDQDEAMAPYWLDSRVLARYGFGGRPSSAPAYAGPIGEKYHHAVASLVARIESPTQGGVLGDSLDVRHPLLYRPLVELSLRLPPELRARPHAHRWLFREAVRGILPDAVRTRVGKPTTSDFLLLSLSTRRRHLEHLLDRPILADLGVLDGARLRTAFNSVSRGLPDGSRTYGTLFRTLAVEAWLQIRSGRWPQGSRYGSKAGSMHAHTPLV
jgi:asparagine synthase (glutamine-hydrolysing)